MIAGLGVQLSNGHSTLDEHSSHVPQSNPSKAGAPIGGTTTHFVAGVNDCRS